VALVVGLAVVEVLELGLEVEVEVVGDVVGLMVA
jgi:hypothetical protein